jgi:hypothetical protein
MGHTEPSKLVCHRSVSHPKPDFFCHPPVKRGEVPRSCLQPSSGRSCPSQYAHGSILSTRSRELHLAPLGCTIPISPPHGIAPINPYLGFQATVLYPQVASQAMPAPRCDRVWRRGMQPASSEERKIEIAKLVAGCSESPRCFKIESVRDSHAGSKAGQKRPALVLDIVPRSRVGLRFHSL